MQRPQITAVNHYDVFPFNHGGSLGIRGLYKALSEWFDINIVTFVNWDIYPDEVPISKHIKVIPIVKPRYIIDLEEEMHTKYNMRSATLIDDSPAVGRYYHNCPEIVNRVREITKDSLIVLAEHTFTYRIIAAACPDKHLWYRANNVEYDYKRTTYDKIGCPQDLLQETFDLEKECCENCELILTVSGLEAKRFTELYGITQDKCLDIHSGFDTDDLHTVLPSQREKFSPEYSNTGLFIASYTPATVLAAMDIIKTALILSDVLFIIMGSVGKGLRNIDIPENVIVTGIVSDEFKFKCLKTCDFALNLIEGGAGINVKMFEYFAYGLPVISTEHGARGIDLTDRKDCFITQKGMHTADISEFCALNSTERKKIASNALVLLQEKYSWRSIGKMIVEKIQTIYTISLSESQIDDLNKIALYKFDSKKSYIPSKPCYVRGGGEWGQKCVEYLLDDGITPLCVIDEDSNKHGKEIKGIKIIPYQDAAETIDQHEVVVALIVYVPVAAQLLNLGVAIEDISLAFYGEHILSLAELKGDCPYYYIAEKIVTAIQNEAKRMREETLGENWTGSTTRRRRSATARRRSLLNQHDSSAAKESKIRV